MYCETLEKYVCFPVQLQIAFNSCSVVLQSVTLCCHSSQFTTGFSFMGGWHFNFKKGPFILLVVKEFMKIVFFSLRFCSHLRQIVIADFGLNQTKGGFYAVTDFHKMTRVKQLSVLSNVFVFIFHFHFKFHHLKCYFEMLHSSKFSRMNRIRATQSPFK